ncbi:MAG: hypothetical protein RMK52_00365 [Chitinophagales bacterium]|nr:hypothetical protein [Chitinophagales bacterium]MDW8392679.1 hypothetical protein [Chitinophagales bacterium]
MIPVISADQIPQELLCKEDVFADQALRRKRIQQLQQAARRNRMFYSKAIICFETLSGPKQVCAHIWEVTDTYLILKGGINLPIACVREVSISDN